MTLSTISLVYNLEAIVLACPAIASLFVSLTVYGSKKIKEMRSYSVYLGDTLTVQRVSGAAER